MKKVFILPLLFIITAIEISPLSAEQALVQNQERPKLVLYYSPTCPHSIRVLNYLKAINKTVPMKNVYASQEVKDELSRQGGKLQVPCLFINGNPLYDDEVIIQWLADNKDLY